MKFKPFKSMFSTLTKSVFEIADGIYFLKTLIKMIT